MQTSGMGAGEMDMVLDIACGAVWELGYRPIARVGSSGVRG